MKNIAVALVVVVLAQLSASRPVRACSIASGTAVPFASFPADGATNVPLNVTPFVRGLADLGTQALTGIALIGPDELQVAHTVAATVVTDLGGPVELLQLLPGEELLPDSIYRIVHDGGDIAMFTTGVVADEEAPRLTSTEVSETFAPSDDEAPIWPFQAVYDCEFPGAAKIAWAASEPVIAFAALAAEPSLSTEMVASSRDDDLFVSVDSDRKVRVLAVDMAGHLSNVESVDVELPKEEGCAQWGPSSAPLLVALLVLRRRRSPTR
jgi:hypothetical protein